MISPEATFEYVAVMPDELGATFSCNAESSRVGNDQQHRVSKRLVGSTPKLHVEDAGPTPDPGPSNPATQRSRIRLIASEKANALVAETSIILDRGLILALRPRDLLHIVRTSCGGIGVSAIRSDHLIFAFGAITVVALGRDFEARIPNDLVREAEGVFRTRDSRFRFAEYPVEIRASGEEH